jgi:FAD/FMN-containing dehydrogenase
MENADLRSDLHAVFEASSVLTDEASRALLSSDLHISGQLPLAVVRPTSTAQIAELAKIAQRHSLALIPRGGGLSYTGGYAPPHGDCISVDLSQMNKILSISAEDLTITVEAGTTWKQIHDALQPLGLRTPFMGTFSGAGASVGGGLSHGALFFGSARYGSAAENMLGMTIVLANGSVLKTGQASLAVDSKPILRTFGPDLGALFTHDGGMFGIKTEATVRLIRILPEQDYASFAFPTIEPAVDALCEIARADIAEEVYILDPHSIAAVDADAATMATTAINVAKSAGGVKNAMKALASLASGGTDFIPAGYFSLHLTTAGRSAAAVKADIEAATKIAVAAGGLVVAPTIPRVARADMFPNLNGVFGPHGERWAALNAKVAHSDARKLVAAFDEMIAPYREEMAQHGVYFTRLASALANHCFSFEPVFRWKDTWLPRHRSAVDASHLATLSEPPANPEAQALVNRLRAETVELFRQLGAASNQIGRSYPFREALSPEPEALLTAIKSIVDPQGRMNPGVLGFA